MPSDLMFNFPLCQIDIGYSATMAPEEMSGSFAQDMWPFGFTPKIHQGPTLLRPVGYPLVSGWVR